MSDRLHDHLTLGSRPGCVACAQLEADLAICRRQRRVPLIRTDVEMTGTPGANERYGAQQS